MADAARRRSGPRTVSAPQRPGRADVAVVNGWLGAPRRHAPAAPLVAPLQSQDEVRPLEPAPFGWAQRGWPPRATPWPTSGLRVYLASGSPTDFVECVESGADVVVGDEFVTLAAVGGAYVGSRRVSAVENAWAGSPDRLDPSCGCATCGFATRGYLHHMFQAKEMSGPTLLALHNLWTMQHAERELRALMVRREVNR